VGFGKVFFLVECAVCKGEAFGFYEPCFFGCVFVVVVVSDVLLPPFPYLGERPSFPGMFFDDNVFSWFWAFFCLTCL